MERRRRAGGIARGASVVLALAASGVLTAAGALLPGSLAAQLVTGTVTDATSGQPLDGALVSLHTADEAQVGTGLTRRDGSYVIRPPGPGRYTVSVERIGYRTAESQPFTVGEATLRVDLRLETRAITVEGLEVRGERRCDVDPGEGEALSVLWDEARKALRVAAWTEESGYVRYTSTHFVRRVDPETGRVIGEERSRRQGFGQRVFRSVPAEELERAGYVVPEGQHRVFLAPDAEVLLSDSFQRTHCFGIESEGGRVGLAFEPAPERRVPDIRGVLWFEPGSMQLDRLDYRYVGYEPAEIDPALRSEVDFERLPGGGWIVRSWVIRMPEAERIVGPGGRNQLRLVRMVEEGGRVQRLEVRGDTAAVEVAVGDEDAPTGSLVGSVIDSTTMRPLGGASVFLSGTGYATEADEAGAFRFEDVPAGRYRIAADHPRIAELGIASPGDSVTVVAGRSTRAPVGVPSRRTLALRSCRGLPGETGEPEAPEREEKARTGQVAGIVLDEAGEPVVGHEITLRISRFRTAGGGDPRSVEEAWLERTATTDGLGSFAFCDVAVDRTLTLRWRDGRGRDRTRSVERLGQGDVRWVEITAPGR